MKKNDSISRSALLAAYDAAHKGPPGGARKLIEEAPGLDVAPVVHGYWIGTSYDGYADGNPVYDEWECSECGWEHKGEDEPKYCQHCGARMDAEAPTCDTCRHHLGGGQCTRSLERECRDGGFEAWEAKDDAKQEKD